MNLFTSERTKRAPYALLHPETIIREINGASNSPAPTLAEKNPPQEKKEYLVGLSWRKFYKIGETEHWILDALDGQSSSADIRADIIRKYDVDIRTGVITEFIRELEGYGLITYRTDLRKPKTLKIPAPLWLYRWISPLLSRIGILMVMTAALAGVVWTCFYADELLAAAEPLYSFWFLVGFIGIYLATSFFHELGHGAAIGRFGFTPEPIHVRRGADLFLLHFSIPFIMYKPAGGIERGAILTITAGGFVMDWLQSATGILLYNAGKWFPHASGWLIPAGLFLTLTAWARLLLSANIFNEKSDFARFLVHYTGTPHTELRKKPWFRLAGSVLWLAQYLVAFYLLYAGVVSIRRQIALVNVPGK